VYTTLQCCIPLLGFAHVIKHADEVTAGMDGAGRMGRACKGPAYATLTGQAPGTRSVRLVSVSQVGAPGPA
jgi:hypothetical protein